MTRTRILAGLSAAALLLAGCETTNHAVFVTTTSLGFNFDTAPSSASIAYDRAEGFIGPSYDNGAIPPVLATIETDGNVIAPKVRQIYGTGAAAIIAAGGTATGPTELSSSGRHLAFFGTSTTVGLKAAFNPETVLSSFNLGFKRKEFSDIWLGSKDGHDVYPSVLASLDMTSGATTPSGVMLTVRQFIASGPAAEAMARTEAGRALKASAINVAAAAAGRKDAAAQIGAMDQVAAYVTSGGSWDAARLATLVDKATGLTPAQAAALKAAGSEADLRRMVGDDAAMANSLAAAAKA